MHIVKKNAMEQNIIIDIPCAHTHIHRHTHTQTLKKPRLWSRPIRTFWKFPSGGTNLSLQECGLA